jgi:hypothetical protein
MKPSKFNQMLKQIYVKPSNFINHEQILHETVDYDEILHETINLGMKPLILEFSSKDICETVVMQPSFIVICVALPFKNINTPPHFSKLWSTSHTYTKSQPLLTTHTIFLGLKKHISAEIEQELLFSSFFLVW